MFEDGKGTYIYENGELKKVTPLANVLVSSVADLPALETVLAPGSTAYTSGGGEKFVLGLDHHWIATGEKKKTCTLTAGSDSKTYDGTALTKETVTASGLPDGYTATASAGGTITDAGTVPNPVTEYVIKDGNEKDVTDEFLVTLVPGTLTVNKRGGVLKSASATKAYDGEPLTAHEFATTPTFPTGEGIEYTFTGSQTEVGESQNKFTVNGFTEGTNPDNYDPFTIQYGTLTVTEAEEASDGEGT